MECLSRKLQAVAKIFFQKKIVFDMGGKKNEQIVIFFIGQY